MDRQAEVFKLSVPEADSDVEVLEFLKLIPMLTPLANSAAILPNRSRSWRHHCPDTACHFRQTSRASGWRK
jgi:hypothetical protein